MEETDQMAFISGSTCALSLGSAGVHFRELVIMPVIASAVARGGISDPATTLRQGRWERMEGIPA